MKLALRAPVLQAGNSPKAPQAQALNGAPQSARPEDAQARRAEALPTIRPATSAEVATMNDWCRRRYEAGDAVIVSVALSNDEATVAIPVRSPLTRARLAELARQRYAVLTLTPARYPERAYQMVEAEWEEVEVMGAPEDARCDAAKEVLPTTHVNGLRRVAPDEFARLCMIGCGRVEVADAEAFAREWEEAFPPVAGEICPGCNGSGEGRTERLRCSTCGGSGEVAPQTEAEVL